MSLHIDYGTHQVTLKYYVAVIWEIRREQVSWCEQTFKPNTWRFQYDHGLIYFKRKQDMIFFKLRWM